MTNSKNKPLREPLSRLWFLSRGYKQADPRYTKGSIVWLHPKTNDVLNQYGQKIPLRAVPYEKYMANTTRYLVLSYQHGSMYLARLKYLTFVGPIPEGYVIDHIDGNTFNNDIRNLRAVPRAINDRDGGFMRKLRNKGIIVAMFPGIILEGYERMAEWKASHTKWQYKQLEKDDLLRIFLGPTFSVVDVSDLDDLSINRHYDPFVERD
jgi:hypothetical protein